MRRILLALAALIVMTGPIVLSAPTQAAPDGPQCATPVLPCEGPVQKVEDTVQRIVRMCQYAYCVFP